MIRIKHEPLTDGETQEYLQKMYQRIVIGWGGGTLAIEDLAERCKMTVSAVSHILKGRSKSVNITHYGKIRAAYRAFLHEQREAINAEIKAEEAKDAMAVPADLLDRVLALRSRFETVKKELAA